MRIQLPAQHLLPAVKPVASSVQQQTSRYSHRIVVRQPSWRRERFHMYKLILKTLMNHRQYRSPCQPSAQSFDIAAQVLSVFHPQAHPYNQGSTASMFRGQAATAYDSIFAQACASFYPLPLRFKYHISIIVPTCYRPDIVTIPLRHITT